MAVSQKIVHFSPLTLNFRPKECRIYSGESELFPIHSFDDEGLCLDDRLDVEVLDMSQNVQFKYRTFRFQQIKTIDQKHQVRVSIEQKIKFLELNLNIWKEGEIYTHYQIECKLRLASAASPVKPDEIPNCSCFSDESCDGAAWSYWSSCDGSCKQTRTRNKDDTDEKTESRDCQNLCFFDVEDDIDDELKTCSIQNSRSKRHAFKEMTSQQKTSLKRTSRLMNGSSAYPGSLPYVVRLTFQSFDQFHSDTQAGFLETEKKNYFKGAGNSGNSGPEFGLNLQPLSQKYRV